MPLDDVETMKLISALVTARAAIEAVLLSIASEQPHAEALRLERIAKGECKHENRKSSMGGYWWCPDCGAMSNESPGRTDE